MQMDFSFIATPFLVHIFFPFSHSLSLFLCLARLTVQDDRVYTTFLCITCIDNGVFAKLLYKFFDMVRFELEITNQNLLEEMIHFDC